MFSIATPEKVMSPAEIIQIQRISAPPCVSERLDNDVFSLLLRKYILSVKKKCIYLHSEKQKAMEKKLLCLALLAVAILPVGAQVADVETMFPNVSHVRWWRQSTVLAYSETTGMQSDFVLYTRGVSPARCLPLPADIRVCDVRIKDDTAYFCGTRNGKGVTGLFSIDELSSGNDVTVHYAVIDTIDYPLLFPKAFTRMELFDSFGKTYWAVVADGETSSILHTPVSTVASVRYSGTYWETRFSYNKDTVVRYTDITCLDSLIVGVGTRADRRGCCIRTFERKFDFPYHPAPPNFAIELNTADHAAERVLARRIKGNRMAVAFHVDSVKPGTWLVDLTLQPNGSPSLTPQGYYLPATAGCPYGAGWEMRELAGEGGSMYLLEEAAHQGTGMQSWLHKWQPLVDPAHIGSWTFLPSTILSADVEQNYDDPVTTGATDTATLELRYPVITGMCCSWQRLDPGTPEVPYNVIYSGTDPFTKSFPDNILIIPVKTLNVENICE